MSSTSDNVREIVVETSAFFAKTAELRKIIIEGKAKLSTMDLVVFEFMKLMQSELREATRAKKHERTKMLISIRDRFPRLLADLEIEIKSPAFTSDDLSKLYEEIAKGQDAGDCVIWLKMQKMGLRSILTQNTSAWKKLGADVGSLPR